jgi:hypothetical protein
LADADRTRAVFRGLTAGLAVHFVTCVVFGVLASLRLEGCDTADGLAGAWGLALVLELVLGLVLAAVELIRHRGRRSRLVLGWSLSYLPLVLLAAVAIQAINRLPSGCGS